MQRTPRSTRRLSEDEEETQLGNVLRTTGARTSCGVMPRTTTPSTATRRSSSCTCRNRDASQPGRDASTDQWGGDQAQRALTRPLSFAAPPGWRSTNFRMEYLFGFSIAPMPATSAIPRGGTQRIKGGEAKREGWMEKTQEQKKMLPGSLVRSRKTGRVRPLASVYGDTRERTLAGCPGILLG